MKTVQAIVNFPVEVTILVADDANTGQIVDTILAEALRCQDQAGEPVIQSFRKYPEIV